MMQDSRQIAECAVCDVLWTIIEKGKEMLNPGND